MHNYNALKTYLQILIQIIFIRNITIQIIFFQTDMIPLFFLKFAKLYYLHFELTSYKYLSKLKTHAIYFFK